MGVHGSPLHVYMISVNAIMEGEGRGGRGREVLGCTQRCPFEVVKRCKDCSNLESQEAQYNFSE